MVEKGDSPPTSLSTSLNGSCFVRVVKVGIIIKVGRFFCLVGFFLSGNLSSL